MLYNPHRKVPSLESFAAWIDTKNPKESYNWSNSCTCACAQYAQEYGVWGKWRAYRLKDELWHELDELARGKAGHGLMADRHTFGKLAERVRQQMMA